MLPSRQLIFTSLEGALLDPHSHSFAGAEQALAELNHRQIPFILLTSRTRAEIEPLRREVEHGHPFVTESGGGVFIPDGYFQLRIPAAQRRGRYMCVALGRAYAEVTAALEGIAQECGIGVAGFHDMNAREVAQNTRLRHRDAELARSREFDEPFFFTSASERDIQRFVAAAAHRGFQTQRGDVLWRISSGCDPARAVRLLIKLFRQQAHANLRIAGVGSSAEDVNWLQEADVVVAIPRRGEDPDAIRARCPRRFSVVESSGPAAWNTTVLRIIGQY